MVSHKLQRKDKSFWFSTDYKERTQSYGFPQTIKKGQDIMVSHRL